MATASMKDHDNRMLFCCCNTTSCNHQFRWEPKEKISTTTVEPDNQPDTRPDTKQAAEQKMIIYLLLCVGVVSIISILVLVGCLALPNRTRAAFRKEEQKDKKKKNKIVLQFSEDESFIFSPKEDKEKAQERLEAILNA